MRSPTSVLTIALLVIIAIALASLTKSIDPFLNDLYLKDQKLKLFNILILGLGPVFFLAIAGWGAWVGRFLKTERTDTPVDSIQDFFFGATGITLCCSVLGVFGFITYPISIGLLIGGLVTWKLYGVPIKTILGDFKVPRNWSDSINWLLLTSLVIVLFGYLIKKLVWIPIEHDAHTHYVPYYLSVAESGSLAPNNVWYHFYYSKGCSLYFWVIQLAGSHALSPLNATFFIALILMLTHTLKKTVGQSLAFVFLLIMTAIVSEQPSFLVPVKQHFIMGVGIFALIWFTFLRSTSEFRRVFPVLASVAIFTIFFVPSSALIVIGFIGVATIWGLIARRNIQELKENVLLGIVAVGTMLVMVAWNYLATGMGEINPFRFFWSVADQERFSRWTSPYMVQLLSEGSNPAMGSVSGLTADRILNLEWYASIFKLAVFKPLRMSPLNYICIVTGLVAVIVFLRKEWSQYAKKTIETICILFLALAALSLPVKQETSLLRMYEFAIYLVLLVLFLPIGLILKRFSPPKLLPVLSLVVLAYLVTPYRYSFPKAELDLFKGHKSLAEYFQSTQYFSEDIVKAKMAIGLKERITVLNITDLRFGLVPGKRLETEIDHSYRKWHQMVFAEPEKAKLAFQEEGIHYFLIEAGGNFGTFFSQSPLFSKASFQKNFKVAAHVGNAYILTWQDSPKAGDRIPEELINAWDKKSLMGVFVPIYARVKYYYDKQGENFPIIEDPSLPHLQGWQ